ncbi:Immunoglobulin heavy variable 3-48, partial [Galemys pyrenaicus]
MNWTLQAPGRGRLFCMCWSIRWQYKFHRCHEGPSLHVQRQGPELAVSAKEQPKDPCHIRVLMCERHSERTTCGSKSYTDSMKGLFTMCRDKAQKSLYLQRKSLTPLEMSILRAPRVSTETNLQEQAGGLGIHCAMVSTQEPGSLGVSRGSAFRAQPEAGAAWGSVSSLLLPMQDLKSPGKPAILCEATTPHVPGSPKMRLSSAWTLTCSQSALFLHKSPCGGSNTLHSICNTDSKSRDKGQKSLNLKRNSKKPKDKSEKTVSERAASGGWGRLGAACGLCQPSCTASGFSLSSDRMNWVHQAPGRYTLQGTRNTDTESRDKAQNSLYLQRDSLKPQDRSEYNRVWVTVRGPCVCPDRVLQAQDGALGILGAMVSTQEPGTLGGSGGSACRAQPE